VYGRTRLCVEFVCIYINLSFFLCSLRVAPWAMRKTLNWIQNNYGNVSVYVTSSGVSDDVADIGQYQRDYINEVLKGRSD